MTKKIDKAARAGELLEEAINGALGVLRDKEAPATSRASAVGSAIRLYELLADDDASRKEPSEMTYEELQASIARLREQHAEQGG